VTFEEVYMFVERVVVLVNVIQKSSVLGNPKISVAAGQIEWK
jgi:hypothetical protein